MSFPYAWFWMCMFCNIHRCYPANVWDLAFWNSSGQPWLGMGPGQFSALRYATSAQPVIEAGAARTLLHLHLDTIEHAVAFSFHSLNGKNPRTSSASASRQLLQRLGLSRWRISSRLKNWIWICLLPCRLLTSKWLFRRFPLAFSFLCSIVLPNGMPMLGPQAVSARLPM